jgi:uncharacterized protein related to proFAR isomerase
MIHSWIDLNDLKLVRASSGEKEGYPDVEKVLVLSWKDPAIFVNAETAKILDVYEAD